MSSERRTGPLVVVHGGVDMEAGAQTVAALERAAERGVEAWTRASDALDAATAALAVLEDDPSFNAGLGSVLTREGTVETDGAVADGRRGRFAEVAAVPGLRHPAQLARHLLDDGDTVLLVGPAASAYGEERGFAPSDLRVEEQITALAADEPSRSPFTGRVPAPPRPSETIGCLVVTPGDGVVAASSTGGLRGKRAGRVGDAAVPGAGYWADARIGVLCSGSGEAALKTGLALRVAEKAAASDVAEATRWAVTAAARVGATLAVLAVDAITGDIAAAHNGASFPVVVHDGSRSTVVTPVTLAEVIR